MKGFFASLGWMLFLAVVVLGLLFYNVAHLPLQGRIVRMESEIKMWTQQVQELTDSLRRWADTTDVVFSQSFRLGDLFSDTDSLLLSESGRVGLRSAVERLRASTGTVEVIGHTATRKTPAGSRWRNAWDYSAAAAAEVAAVLIAAGVPAERVVVSGMADTRPLVPRTAQDAAMVNSRVEIVVRRRQ